MRLVVLPMWRNKISQRLINVGFADLAPFKHYRD